MKVNQINILRFKTIILSLVIFLMVFQSAYAGELKHTIYSPYNHVVGASTGSYPSSGQSNTIIEDRYDDFDYNALNSYFDSKQPYCKFGGQYRINVYNNPVYAGVYDNTIKLYYCKTTEDLIKHINIPTSWQNDNLVLYCNDGNNIYDPEFNVDFLTSKVNTYKICVLKNLNLDSQNSIIYGFEAGNKLIDSYASNYFNLNSKTGAIVTGLNNDNSLTANTNTQITKRIYFYVPYVTICSEEGYTSCGFEDYSCSQTLICTKPGISTSMKNTYPTSFNTGVQTLNSYVQNMCTSSGLNCNMATLRTEGDFASASHSYHSIEVQLTLNQNNYIFNGPNNRTYIFEYEQFNHFYTLRELSGDTLNVPIKNIFTKDIGLSRVALFRKIGTSKVYGYEIAIKNANIGTEIIPIYKIEGLSNLGFNENICKKTLANYNPSSNLGGSNKIACRVNGDIYINSLALDGEHNAPNEQGWSLNLFKNIILGIK